MLVGLLTIRRNSVEAAFWLAVLSYPAIPEWFLNFTARDGGIFAFTNQKLSSPVELARIGFECGQASNSEGISFATGPLASTYVFTLGNSTANIIHQNIPCSYETFDSRPFVTSFFNEIMFRSAVLLGSAMQGDTVQAMQTGSMPIYVSHYGYMGGALGVIGLSFAAILFTFYGWWELGRDVTLNPFEVGMALNAPLLKSPVSSNASIDELMKKIGDRKVQYGTVTTTGDNGEVTSRLELASAEDVIPLRQMRQSKEEN